MKAKGYCKAILLWFIRLAPFITYPFLLGNGLGFAVMMEWGKAGPGSAAVLNLWGTLYALLWVAFLIMCVKRRHKLLVWLYAYLWFPGLILMLGLVFNWDGGLLKIVAGPGLLLGLLFDMKWHPVWTICVFILMAVFYFPAIYFLYRKKRN